VPEGDISTREADYSAGGGFIEPETDLFALFAFHLAAPAVISAVTARITCSTGTYLPIALYDAAGQRLLQVHLRATQDGLVSEVLEKAVTLQAGCYRLGWATLHSELRVAALGIGRAERDFLNTAGGEIVVALGHGRQSYTLPKKLDKLELPPERFGLVPQIFLKG
jgi:hypothetical protein